MWFDLSFPCTRRPPFLLTGFIPHPLHRPPSSLTCLTRRFLAPRLLLFSLLTQALRYPPNAFRVGLETAEQRRDREIAEELAELEDDEGF